MSMTAEGLTLAKCREREGNRTLAGAPDMHRCPPRGFYEETIKSRAGAPKVLEGTGRKPKDRTADRLAAQDFKTVGGRGVVSARSGDAGAAMAYRICGDRGTRAEGREALDGRTQPESAAFFAKKAQERVPVLTVMKVAEMEPSLVRAVVRAAQCRPGDFVRGAAWPAQRESQVEFFTAAGWERADAGILAQVAGGDFSGIAETEEGGAA